MGLVIPVKCMAENYSLPINYLKGLCICRIELVFNLFRVRVEGLNVCQRLGMLKALSCKKKLANGCSDACLHIEYTAFEKKKLNPSSVSPFKSVISGYSSYNGPT